jgi:hypothetical protein
VKAIAILCDAATVREGLLHLLGGGITHLGRSAFPSPLDLTLAVQVEMDELEARQSHRLTVTLVDDQGVALSSAQAVWGSAVEVAPGAVPGTPVVIPMALPLHSMTLPAPGAYRIRLGLDNIDEFELRFSVTDRPVAGWTPRPT